MNKENKEIQTNKERKTIYRLAPCPAYHLEMMESWLEDLAEEGLFLSPDGFFFGFGFFYREEPKQVKYRLQAGKTPGGFFSGNDTPEPEELELGEALGWEFVARRGEFDIYRSMQEEVRELNTDPAVQELTLKAVQKRQYSAILSEILWCVVYAFLYFGKKAVIAPILYMKTWFYIFSALLILWMIGKNFVEARYYGRLRRKLKNGMELNRNFPWRQKAWRYPVKNVLAVVSTAVWIGIVLWNIPNDVLFEEAVELKDYSGTPPFATIADLAPGRPYTIGDSWLDFYNQVIEWDDILAPVNCIWREQTKIRLSGEELLDATLVVEYHELRFEWMAKLLAYDYYRMDQERHFRYISNPELGFDYAVYYRDDIGWPNIILRQGKKVLHATFHEYSGSHIAPEQWINLLADSIREE